MVVISNIVYMTDLVKDIKIMYQTADRLFMYFVFRGSIVRCLIVFILISKL